jgi:hypothetical protein
VPHWISEGSDNVDVDASARRNGYHHDDGELHSLEAEELPRVDAGAGGVIRVRLQMDLAGMLSVHSRHCSLSGGRPVLDRSYQGGGMDRCF